MKDSDLVTKYLAHAATAARDGTDAEHFAAGEELQSHVWHEPERAWPIIQEIIARIVDDDILAYVAAGPLEGLLVRHPHAFIDRIEALAKKDGHFRRAVSGVWGYNAMPDEVRRR